jgi:hypothetical protein
MSGLTHPAGRNTAKFKVLRFLANAGGYVGANRLMPLFPIRNFRNMYTILARLYRWELVSRRNGPLGLEWAITQKGRERLSYYIKQGMRVAG